MIILLGTIEAGRDSVALFGTDDDSVARRKGAEVSGFVVGDITRRGVVLHKDGKFWVVRPGDQVGEDTQTVKITQGLERDGETLRVSGLLRDYVTKDGLLAVLNQACSEKVEGGYRLFEIDKGSAFDLAGFRNGDVVTSIDGVELSNPLTAMRMLVKIKDAEKFDYTVVSGGREKTIQVEVLR